MTTIIIIILLLIVTIFILIIIIITDCICALLWALGVQGFKLRVEDIGNPVLAQGPDCPSTRQPTMGLGFRVWGLGFGVRV